MKLQEKKTQLLSIELLQPNEGQILGLPKNPRNWSDEAIDKLKASLQTDPELLEVKPLLVYPYTGEDGGELYCVIGGNMRLHCLRELNIGQVPCMVLPEDTPSEKLRAYTIKDNTTFGWWDWSLLDAEWEDFPLDDWGLEHNHGELDVNDFFDSDSSVEQKIQDEKKNIVIVLSTDNDEHEIRDLIVSTLSVYDGIEIK